MARRHVPGSGDPQVQPAGVDLRIASVEVFREPGALLKDDKEIPEGEIVRSSNGYWRLKLGAYRIRFMDVVEVPLDAVGLCFPRSSLLRMGATLNCAVWDPGYKGRGQALLLVHNPFGVFIEEGSRIAQLVFIRLVEKTRRGYSGSYQGEGL